MENIRYDTLEVKEGVYVPEIGKTYPQDDPYIRLVHTPHDREIAFDESYPYLDDSRKFRIHNWLTYSIALRWILNAYLRIKFGLRIHGRHNLRKHKALLQNGAISFANHIWRFDGASILIAMGCNRHTRIPMYAPNFATRDHYALWSCGGVPIPESMSALKQFNAAFDEFHRRGYWIHLFPEAARWDYYKPIRPFRKGAFTMAYKYNMPLLPCVFTFRPRTGIYRLFGKPNEPLVSLEIGEPILPDTTQPRHTEVERLNALCHKTLVQMAGITHNTWE